MAWRVRKVEEQRRKLIEDYQSGEASITALSIEYGISRKTAYKWLRRHRDQGDNGLIDLSRAPKHPCRIYSKSLIDLAVELKHSRPRWGPKKILAYLENKHPDLQWPSQTWLYEIFKSFHLTKVRRLRKRVPATAPLGQLTACNDIWIADFKGWFRTQSKEICEPLTISDAYSRFLIGCVHLHSKDSAHVWPIFERAFEEYGLPKRVRTDNGPPFGSRGAGRLTKLSVNLIKAGVQPEWINPGHPEENGRHERFHLTLKDAVADPPARTLKEQISRMCEFVDEYNFDRPHEALDMQTPAGCYSCSVRKWDGRLRGPEYDTSLFMVRKICPSGALWFKGIECYISSTLQGEYVGLRESDLGGMEVHYGPVFLGILDHGELKQPKLCPKRVIRRG